MSDALTSALENFMSVKQVAAYLHLNEKKIYTLVNEGQIPATKVTGKWMFPRELVDRWILDSSHGGLLTDRLVIAGSDDPLLYRIVTQFVNDAGSHALISYTPTGTRGGLDLLQSSRADACCIHWGPDIESHLRHPALLLQYPQHHQWILIRLFRREQGVMLSAEAKARISETPQLFDQRFRWALRQKGAGAQRFLMEMLSRHNLNADQLNSNVTALSEREAAAAIAMGVADAAPGVRAAAVEYGLKFVPVGWECFDLALPRGIWFRRLLQELLARLRSKTCLALAESLGGYDLEKSGELVWGDE
jgi:putative molybdopterin biosynthesis protein